MLKTNLPIIKQGLATLGYLDDVSRVSLMLNSVTFVDGSMWVGDEFSIPIRRIRKTRLIRERMIEVDDSRLER